MGFTDKLKTVFTQEEEYEYENEEEFEEELENQEEEEQVVEQPKPVQQKQVRKPQMKQQTQTNDIDSQFSDEFNGKDAGVILLEPKTFTEAKEIGEFIKTNTAVCLNLSTLDPSDAKRIIDFVSGVIFALDGKIKKIAPSVFLCAPKNIGLAGKISQSDANAQENVKKW